MHPTHAASLQCALAVALTGRGMYAAAEAPLRAARTALEQDAYLASQPELAVLEQPAERSTAGSAESESSQQPRLHNTQPSRESSVSPETSAPPPREPRWGTPAKLSQVAGMLESEMRVSLEARANVPHVSTDSSSSCAISRPAAAAQRTQLHARVLFYLALSLYQCNGATGAALTGCLDDMPDAAIGNRFFRPLDYMRTAPHRASAARTPALQLWHAASRASDCGTQAHGMERESPRSGLLEAVRVLTQAEALLDTLADDSAPADLVLADVADAQGCCALAAGSAERALRCHRRAKALRCKHVASEHILLGHSHLNCGLALSSLQVRTPARSLHMPAATTCVPQTTNKAATCP